MRAAIDAGLARQSKQEWQKIRWRTSASAALSEARAESKPIFIFFVVKQQAPSPTKWTGQSDDQPQSEPVRRDHQLETEDAEPPSPSLLDCVGA